jgi:hypothetical protein
MTTKAKKATKAGEGKQSRGRPSTYSIEEAAKICAWIVSGKSLAAYCKQADTPHVDTVYTWRAKHKEFADLYARARRSGGYFGG